MVIQTKYNIGDNLFFITHNRIVVKKIKAILIEVKDINNIRVEYGYKEAPDDVMGSNPIIFVNEVDAFFTKDELIKSL